ncbi:DNA polymerase III subunit gamma/tau, partial [Salmonella enterica subsp. enterica serovar Infantis]
SEPAAASRARPVNNSALERLASGSERVQARPAPSALETAPGKKEAYRWKATTPVVQTNEVVATPKALKKALAHEKTPELAAKLSAEAIERDPWA